MSPLVERGLANFKANRRGYYSLWVFGILFVVTLFAEFIANDKPIVIVMDGKIWFPVVEFVSERDLGGELDIVVDYTDPYIEDLLESKNAFTIYPPIPYAYDTVDFYVLSATPAWPSAQHWLGTDDRGKDTLARLIYGFRLSVLFGLILTSMAAVIGISVGAVQGYFGGLTDLVGQRLVEIWVGLPTLLILIIMSTIVERNLLVMLILLTLFSWMPLSAVVRAEFLRTRNFDYVRAARSLGVPNPVIMRRHVLPNAMVATLTNMPFILCTAVTTLTALDFLGLGLPEGAPSLGELMNQGKANVEAPFLGLTGFFTLAIMLCLLIFISEGVRDAFDPRRVLALLATKD